MDLITVNSHHWLLNETDMKHLKQSEFYWTLHAVSALNLWQKFTSYIPVWPSKMFDLIVSQIMECVKHSIEVQYSNILKKTCFLFANICCSCHSYHTLDSIKHPLISIFSSDPWLQCELLEVILPATDPGLTCCPLNSTNPKFILMPNGGPIANWGLSTPASVYCLIHLKSENKTWGVWTSISRQDNCSTM